MIENNYFFVKQTTWHKQFTEMLTKALLVCYWMLKNYLETNNFAEKTCLLCDYIFLMILLL